LDLRALARHFDFLCGDNKNAFGLFSKGLYTRVTGRERVTSRTRALSPPKPICFGKLVGHRYTQQQGNHIFVLLGWTGIGVYLSVSKELKLAHAQRVPPKMSQTFRSPLLQRATFAYVQDQVTSPFLTPWTAVHATVEV